MCFKGCNLLCYWITWADCFVRIKIKRFFVLIVSHKAWINILCMLRVPIFRLYRLVLFTISEGFQKVRENVRLAPPTDLRCQMTMFLHVFRSFLSRPCNCLSRFFAVDWKLNLRATKTIPWLPLQIDVGDLATLPLEELVQWHRPFRIRALWQTQTSKPPQFLSSYVAHAKIGTTIFLGILCDNRKRPNYHVAA